MPYVAVYFNTHQDHFSGYKHGHAVCKVFSYDAPASSGLDDLAEEAFAAFNAPLESLDPAYRSIAEGYRAAGNRSLSVGDVLCIGDAWLACATYGWVQVDEAPIEVDDD